MKILTLISAIITTLLLLTTMICGLWLRANGIDDSGSISFHMNSGIASVIFCFITLILFSSYLFKNRKGDVK
jgi:uncharacterized BrkB/YihY/UPF0761 family membrane protein